MASPLSIGIELQPPGVDQRWVRIWVLDAAACRLVVHMCRTKTIELDGVTEISKLTAYSRRHSSSKDVQQKHFDLGLNT